MKLDLEGHPSFGQKVTLWTYSPPRGEFISHPEYRSFTFSHESGLIYRAIRWINVGYFFYPADMNPNDAENENLKPIMIPEAQLNSFGCTNHYMLKASNLKQACLNDREDTDNVKKMLAKGVKPTKAAKKASEASPFEKLISSLTTDKISKSQIPSYMVTLIQSKGYNLLSDDVNYWIEQS